MRLIIKSRKLGRELDFIMPEDGGYVHLWSTERWFYEQICEGGGFRGETLRSSPDRFKADCRKWYRAYVRRQD